MSKIFTISCIALFYLTNVSAQKLTAYFSYCTFGQPNGSPYIEAYLSVIGQTVKFLPNANQKLQSKIELQWVLKQKDKIIYYDKYNLLSPELATDSASKPNFLDQKRISAENGDYLLELTISDKNTSISKYTVADSVHVLYFPDKLLLSDVELLESFEKSGEQNKMFKSGYNLVPYISNFFPQEINSIKFYAELYNAKKVFGENDFLVRYQIVNEGNKQILNDLVGYKKLKPDHVNTVIGELPINNLSSGNYSLVIEVRNSKNEQVAYKSVFFQRSKPIPLQEIPVDFTLMDIKNTFVANYSNNDSLKEYIACLYPISGSFERQMEDNQIAIKNNESMKQFMYYFWSKRAPENPMQGWLEYKQEVDKVNAAYGTFNKKGYDSDRGRVYLQYGPPNTIDIGEREPNTYLHEIWHYYTINGQTNRKFVFYSRELSTNNYELLHSDVTGEPSAYDWQLKLHEGINQYGPDIDADKAPSSYGDRSQERFNDPK